MAQQITRGSKSAEVLVIGSNMSALLLAEHLRQAGRDVVLLEPAERFGSNHLAPDLGFIPDNESARTNIAWMANLLRADASLQSVDSPPVTYDEGHLKTFVGFGDHNPPAREEISFYTPNSHLEVTPTLSQMSAGLIAEPKFQVHSRKEVTRILAVNGQIEGVEVNGDEIWRAPQVIWTLGLSRLLELFPQDAIEGKHRQRFAKAHTWTSVMLQLRHSHSVTMERGIHVLYGSGHESDPVVGRFWPALAEGGQTSAWMTLVPGEFDEDPDSLSHALKHLKRQLKRAHPHVMADLLEEKLLVTSESHGHMKMPSQKPFVLAELKGFIFASHLLSDQRGTLAAIDVARQASELVEQVSSRLP
jgi:glycine/D-amino acid oxidase-like deaminating enzyme